MRFLLDENLEHEVFHRLRNGGHEVRHVDLSEELSKGDSDGDLAAFSRESQFVIVTYDDDFRDDLSAKTVAGVLDEISTYYDGSDLRGFLTIGRSWL